jgi:hypothetical protein
MFLASASLQTDFSRQPGNGGRHQPAQEAENFWWEVTHNLATILWQGELAKIPAISGPSLSILPSNGRPPGRGVVLFILIHT